MRSKTVSIDLTRTISAEQWNTICLPFAMTSEQIAAVFGADAEVRELTAVENINGELFLEFTEVNAIDANKPYIINGATVGTNFLISGVNYNPSSDNSVTINGLVFQGNYTYPTILDNAGGQDYYLTNNLFKSSKGGTKIKGFRAYFKDTNSNSSVKSLSLSINGEITSVNTVEAEDGNFVVLPANVYAPDGRLVRRNATDLEGLPKGLYIIGSKKIHVK